MTRDDLDQSLAQATSPDWRTRVYAIHVLRTYDDSRAMDAVIRGLDDDDLAVVGAATTALLEAQVGKPLLAALTKEEEVAQFVADLIADASPEWLVTFLIGLLSGTEGTDWRVAAAETLGFILESRAALPALLAASDGDDARVRDAARRAVDHLSASN